MTSKIKLLKSKPTIEGAGVHLKRAFGYNEVPLFDPFLLFDDFSSDDPRDYILGFPWHPHRGIETVTYVIEGMVEHEDSLGNKGVIQSGDVQWMTAGSGIVHQEMPQQYRGKMWGFQLWVNLPASHKMMNPRYRDVKKEQIPKISYDAGVQIKIVSGEIKGAQGPVRDLIVDSVYLDISVTARTEFSMPVKNGHRAFAYVVSGSGRFLPEKNQVMPEHIVRYQETDTIDVRTEHEPLRFLFISGIPIEEPVAWYGPIVMNTQEELDRAFQEYREGTFIKYRGLK
ncbi:pirin [candidate division WOR_3 bacterium SM23_60]|uniref:Pirin n=1 Tax=candidate division WOR_3 bacterium SM23_60 TaxID=1703780 RepID=A0A0S8GJS8_UNCW3|nr:MAG: pirin [candidate division WOR_3 bacterium SM23_60]